jgi:rsbT co-antagonist protein RsbR
MWNHISVSLLTVRHADPDVRRRGRLFLIACLVVIGFLILFVPLLVLVRQMTAALAIVGVLPLVLGALVLARSGRVLAGAALLLTILLLEPPVVILARGSLAVTPFFFAFSVLVGGLSLRPWQIWPLTALALALLTGVAVRISPNAADGALRQNILVGSALLVVGTSLFAFLGATVNRAALREETLARGEADAARNALQDANASLEAQVAERTAELRHALNVTGERAATQERLLAELAAQREVIREMSVPVLPVSAATLVMPLVGILDSARLRNLQHQALVSVEQAQARRLIIDITGVPVLDIQVARGLVETTRAVALLGAEVMLVGVRPEVAQTIVSLGVDLQGLRAVSTLEAALASR